MAQTRLIGDKPATFAAAGLASAATKHAHLVALRIVDARTFHPVIDRVDAVDAIADAYRHVDTGHKIGSVILPIRNSDPHGIKRVPNVLSHYDAAYNYLVLGPSLYEPEVTGDCRVRGDSRSYGCE